jgi:hypothetical protein
MLPSSQLADLNRSHQNLAPQQMVSVSRQYGQLTWKRSKVIPHLNRLHNVQFFLVRSETCNLLLFSINNESEICRFSRKCGLR